MRYRLLTWTSLLVAALGLGSGACAQVYPERPLRLIVPFPPGGPNDLLARLVGQMLKDALGQQVIIDNRGGAGGTIGAEMAARAAPDGYTLLFAGAAVLSINPSMNKQLPYDALKDFAAISMVATAPSVLVSHPALPVSSVGELIALTRASPGRINYASAGIGTNPHLAGELFKFMTGVDMLHVPYKGGAPALTDLIAGQVQLYFAGIAAVVPYVNAGQVRALAVTGAERSALLPAVPTFAEAGMPAYDVGNWYAVLAPKGTDAAQVRALNAAIQKGLGNADRRRRIQEMGAQPLGGSPAQLAATIAAEIEKWTKVVRAANIRAE